MLQTLRQTINSKILQPSPNAFDRAGLSEILDETTIVSLDIGARGGAQADLLPLARAVNLYGFEPDPEEYERLKAIEVGQNG